ncbi:MerR family transcriptional regulator [Geodermatophilus sp. SYSU D01105]
MDDDALAIGRPAGRLGVPVRTVRFWSDEGLVDPPTRSAGGYRLYDAAAVARQDLVRTPRQLGLGLPAVRELLARRRTVAEVADEHVRALAAEIRLLRLRRTLPRVVATAGTTTEEMRIVHELAALSARERQQLIDDFVARAFAGVPEDAPGAGIAAGMRTLPAELPEDPTPEQVGAWLELARLVADPAFADRVREMAVAGAAATPEDPDATGVDAARMVLLGRRALASDVLPRTPEAEALVADLAVGGAADRPGPPPGARRPAGDVHRRPRRALLAAARRPQRVGAVRAVCARGRVVDPRPPRGGVTRVTTWLLVHPPLLGPAVLAPLAAELRRRGGTLAVPDLRATVETAPGWPERRVASAAEAGPADVVVGFSGAGMVLTAVAAAARAVRAVWLDAVVPRAVGGVASGDPGGGGAPGARRADRRLDDVVGPRRDDRSAARPAGAGRDPRRGPRTAGRLLRRRRPGARPVAGRDVRYVQLSPACDRDAAAARARGWDVRGDGSGAHLDVGTDPARVADLLA